MKRILGIDPGVANLGWAVIGEEAGGYKLAAGGCFRTRAGRKMDERLGEIYEELSRVVAEYKVTGMAVEGVYFARNVKSALKVAEVIGVVRLCGRRRGLEVREYTPLQIKMALTGYGQAAKEQVEAMVRNFLKAEGFKSGHAADAAAVGLTDWFTNRRLEGRWREGYVR